MMLSNRKVEKVCTGWQTGIYPKLAVSDVVEGCNRYWISDVVEDCHPYWINEFKMVLFEIGLEDLDFLVERKDNIGRAEDIREIGYPKVVKVTKIKDFVKPALVSNDENWEWIYWGRVKHTEYKIEVVIEQTTIVNTNDYVWLQDNEKPLYRLGKQYNFTNIEKLYYKSRDLVKYRIYKAENWYKKVSKNVFVHLGQYVTPWLVTAGIYKYYFGFNNLVIECLLLISLMWMCCVLNSVVDEIKWVIKVIGELLRSIFFALSVTITSMPKETQADKTMFSWLFTALLITVMATFLINIYFVPISCRVERELMKL